MVNLNSILEYSVWFSTILNNLITYIFWGLKYFFYKPILDALEFTFIEIIPKTYNELFALLKKRNSVIYWMTLV